MQHLVSCAKICLTLLMTAILFTSFDVVDCIINYVVSNKPYGQSEHLEI